MHTAALHSRFTNCAPNTRALTSQGSRIEILQPFFGAGGGCSEMSVCFPLATKLPEMHPFSREAPGACAPPPSFINCYINCSPHSTCSFRLCPPNQKVFPKPLILTSFNTILIPCLLVLFSPDVRQQLGEVKSRREWVKI